MSIQEEMRSLSNLELIEGLRTMLGNIPREKFQTTHEMILEVMRRLRSAKDPNARQQHLQEPQGGSHVYPSGRMG